jgi:hypothetical protein
VVLKVRSSELRVATSCELSIFNQPLATDRSPPLAGPGIRW